MRKLIILMTIVLSVSGLVLVFGPFELVREGWGKAVSLSHIWIGNFFLVLFPLYAWDHISHNRAWLRRVKWATASGMLQSASAALLMLSGIVLLMYGNEVWPLLRAFHHYLTYPLAAAIVVHYLAKKT